MDRASASERPLCLVEAARAPVRQETVGTARRGAHLGRHDGLNGVRNEVREKVDDGENILCKRENILCKREATPGQT